MRGSASGAPSTSTPTSHPRSRCSSGARGMFRGFRRKPLSTSSLCWPKATLNHFIHAFHCRSGTGRSRLEGGHYTGRLVNNQMDGRGTFRYHMPLDNYDGQWFQGVKEGRGKYTWADGTTYDGQWAKGEKEGWGVLAKPNGGRYEGMWKAGHWSSGTYWFEDGVPVPCTMSLYHSPS
ncbi:hypothetical protein Pelo_19082 [Pelomyxa schiedti]|nr:hypothetical protein Pelo_19082 [Pelomyxa schiedti]